MSILTTLPQATASRKPRVVYWNNIPSPYMVDRFNMLADRGTLEFEAWFSTRTEADRSWSFDENSWRFRHRYLRGIGRGAGRLELPAGLVGRHRPDLLVCLYASPSVIVGRLLAGMGGTKVAFWAEVTFDAWVRRRPWKEALKRVLFSSVDAVVTAGDDGRRFAERYGTPPDRIFFTPHSIDVDRFAAVASTARAKRQELRARLGAAGCTFMYVGRLWEYGKGLGHLLDAFAKVSQEPHAPVTLVLVGDGPDEAPLRQRATDLGLRNVVFRGFVPSEALPELYVAADVFVFPTLGDPYGLVLDEAMACSLPLISTSAVGELHLRISDGLNGLIVPPADSVALARAMSALAADSEGRMRMGAESRRLVEGRTPERWAKDFERAVSAILGGASASRTHAAGPARSDS